MDINISAKHVEVDDEIKAKANELAQRLASDYPNQKISSVRVLFAAERAFRIVEVLVNAKNLSLHAAAKLDDTSASLASAFAKLDVQMGRYLSKIRESAVKADPKLKDKIWRSTDLKEENDDADLDGYDYVYEEK